MKSHKANFFALTDFILIFLFAKITAVFSIIIYRVNMISEL
jgi:hypothetical protein